MNRKFWAKQAKLITDTSAILDLSGVLGGEEDFKGTGTHFYSMQTGDYIGHQENSKAGIKELSSKTNLIFHYPQDKVCFTSANPNAMNFNSAQEEQYNEYVLEHYHSDFDGEKTLRINHGEFLKKIIYLYGESGGGLEDWYAWTHHRHVDKKKSKNIIGHKYSTSAEDKISGKIRSQGYVKIKEYLNNGLNAQGSYADYMRKNVRELALACYRSLNNRTIYRPENFQLHSPSNWLGWFENIDLSRKRTNINSQKKPVVFLTEIIGKPFKSISDLIGRMESPEGRGVSCSIFYSYEQEANAGSLVSCPIYFRSTSGKTLLAEIPEEIQALSWWLNLPNSYHETLFNFYKNNSF